MPVMRACARVERMATPWVIPGSSRSSAYFARPVTLASPSTRGTDVPTISGMRHRLRGVEHGVDDLLVARAAADAALEPVHDLLAGRPRVVLEQRLRRHHHAGGAEAALERRALEERALHR